MRLNKSTICGFVQNGLYACKTVSHSGSSARNCNYPQYKMQWKCSMLAADWPSIATLFSHEASPLTCRNANGSGSASSSRYRDHEKLLLHHSPGLERWPS